MKTPAIDKDFDPARMHPAPDRPFPAKPFREAEIMWRRLSLMWCRLSLGENPVAFANPSTKPSTMPVALVAWSALGIALNVGLARFAYGIVLPSLRRDLDLNYLTSGSLNAVHLLGYLVGTLAAPSLARIIGLRTLLVRAHVLVAAGALLCAITPHGISDGIPDGTLNGTLNGASGPLVLGVGRLATGIGAGGGIVAILVAALGAVPARERPFVSAVVWSGIGAAVIVCAFAAPLLLQSASGWRVSFAASAILALAISIFFPATGFAANQPQASASLDRPAAAATHFDAAQLLTPRWWFLVATYLLFGVGYIAYATFAGAQFAAAHIQPSIVGLTWAAFGVAVIVGAALAVPVLGATRIKRFALFGAMACGSLGSFVLGAFAPEDSAGATLGGAILVGLGVAATPTIVSAYARERCSAEDYAKAFSYATAALGIGQLVGPVAAGALADHFGMAAVPSFAASAYSIGGLLALCDAVAARSTTHNAASAILQSTTSHGKD
jgi:MFS family permease